jgi:nucleotide-binding universal stress UspA family protein
MNAYRKILVAVDGSSASAKGLREALRLAGREGTSLCILHIVDDLPAFAGMDPAGWMDLVPALRANGKRVLQRARAIAEKAGVKATGVLREILGGPAAGVIVREAKKQGADLIVLGTHGRRGVRRLVLGSDAEQVVRTSPVPVLLVRE